MMIGFTMSKRSIESANLADLLFGMRGGIAGVGAHLLERDILDLKFAHLNPVPFWGGLPPGTV